MKRKSQSRMQWARMAGTLSATVTLGTENALVDVGLADAQGLNLSSSYIKVHRYFGWMEVLITNPSLNDPLGLWVGFSLEHEAVDAPAELGIATDDAADARWLWREIYPRFPHGIAADGRIDGGDFLVTWGCKVDWQFRNGRGAHLQRDNAMKWAVGIAGPGNGAVADTVTVHSDGLLLISVD